MKNKILLGILISLSSLMLTGCWDNVEINERHVVLEIALDKGEEKNTKGNIEDRDYYEITYMIPDIAKLSGEDSLAKNVKTGGPKPSRGVLHYPPTLLAYHTS